MLFWRAKGQKSRREIGRSQSSPEVRQQDGILPVIRLEHGLFLMRLHGLHVVIELRSGGSLARESPTNQGPSLNRGVNPPQPHLVPRIRF